MNNIRKNDIVIVVVIYNITDEQLLKKMCAYNYEYIFVDNSDLQEICTNKILLSRFKYIKNRCNLGIAESLNIGINKAIEMGYKFAITLDQDSYVNDLFVDKLIDSYSKLEHNKDVAIFSPSHSTNNIVSEKNKPFQDVVRYTYNTMTSGNLVNINIWKNIGGFDNSLFIDMVDVDYYLKALSYGYDVVVVSSIILNHGLGNPTVHNFFGKKVIITNHSPLRKYYRFRNTFVLLERYKSANPSIIKKFSKSLLYLFMGVILFENNKFTNLRFMFLGFVDYKRQKLGKYKKDK